MFNRFLYQPILTGLTFLTQLLGNLGLAIIALTLIIRLVLLPLTLPALKSSTKMRELKPELDELKRKYKDDKVGLQQAQMELFKKNKINPAAGCLPYIVQFIILIALYRVFIDFLQPGNTPVDTQFLWFDLTAPDPYYLLPFIAAFSQLILGLMMMPGADTSAEKTLALQTKTKKDDKKAEDMTDMAQSMQQQMIFVMPAITFFFALRFPAGVTVYWITTTLFSIVQQYYVSGWGGLTKYTGKLVGLINRNNK